MPDRRYATEELQDRAAIADLYDRQLAAAEAFDLELDGPRARTRVPVVCHVVMEVGGRSVLTHTGIFYNDELERRPEGWRIVSRVEELGWSETPGAGAA